MFVKNDMALTVCLSRLRLRPQWLNILFYGIFSPPLFFEQGALLSTWQPVIYGHGCEL